MIDIKQLFEKLLSMVNLLEQRFRDIGENPPCYSDLWQYELFTFSIELICKGEVTDYDEKTINEIVSFMPFMKSQIPFHINKDVIINLMHTVREENMSVFDNGSQVINSSIVMDEIDAQDPVLLGVSYAGSPHIFNYFGLLGIHILNSNPNYSSEKIKLFEEFIENMSSLISSQLSIPYDMSQITSPIYDYIDQYKSLAFNNGCATINNGKDSFGQKGKKSSIDDNEKDLDSLLKEIDSLIGLSDVKDEIVSFVNMVNIQNIRKERGITPVHMSMHLVFEGNPRTGKTTVARILAKIYHQLGIISKGHLIEVDRSGLVAGYVGQTAIKVKDVLQQAHGGVLFIDEAYSLATNQNSNDFGQEAIDTLLKGMEDDRDDLIVIVAGYPQLMDQFLNSNPGLRSRFNRFLHFADYKPDELLEIFMSMCTQNGFSVSNDSVEYVRNFFAAKYEMRNADFANARSVRNFFEKAAVNQANRISNIADISNEDLLRIEVSDLKNIVI